MTKEELLEQFRIMQKNSKRMQKMIKEGKFNDLTALQAYEDIDFYIEYTLKEV